MSHAGQRTVEALAPPSGKECKLSIVHNLAVLIGVMD